MIYDQEYDVCDDEEASVCPSQFRLVVKTSLKLLLVFVEYSESNAALLIQAISAVDTERGQTPRYPTMQCKEDQYTPVKTI